MQTDDKFIDDENSYLLSDRFLQLKAEIKKALSYKVFRSVREIKNNLREETAIDLFEEVIGALVTNGELEIKDHGIYYRKFRLINKRLPVKTKVKNKQHKWKSQSFLPKKQNSQVTPDYIYENSNYNGKNK